MKKINLAVVLISSFLFSCGNSTEKVEITKEEYDKLKGLKQSEYPKEVKIDDMAWEITLGSDGHEYCDNNLGNSYACFHYIECEKCKKRQKNETESKIQH